MAPDPELPGAALPEAVPGVGDDGIAGEAAGEELAAGAEEPLPEPEAAAPVPLEADPELAAELAGPHPAVSAAIMDTATAIEMSGIREEW